MVTNDYLSEFFRYGWQYGFFFHFLSTTMCGIQAKKSTVFKIFRISFEPIDPHKYTSVYR